MDRPRLLVRPKLSSRPRLDTVVKRPKLTKFVPMLDLSKYDIASPLPAKRKLKQLKGLVICLLVDALPDPNWPNIKVNLDIFKWALVLDGKIIFKSPTMRECEEWRDKVQPVLNNLAQMKRERAARHS